MSVAGLCALCLVSDGLHRFQKKTRKTPKPDLELAKKRLRELLEELKK